MVARIYVELFLRVVSRVPGMVVVVEFVAVELVVWQCALPLYCLVYLYQTCQGQANLQMLKYRLK